MGGVTLDTGALVAFERADRRMQALVDEAALAGLPITVPAGVVAQAWRDGRRQARLARLLALPFVDVDVLDDPAARAAGVLCGRAGTNDVVDASVVLCARRHDSRVVTGDVADLTRLDPDVAIVEL